LKNVSLHLPENYELVTGARIENIHLYYDFITVAAIADVITVAATAMLVQLLL
jgi:hypothetical protein